MAFLLPFFVILIFIAGIVLAAIAILMGKHPVITEFEARQRGIKVPTLTPEERRSRRAASDATMATAAKLLSAVAAGLVVAGVITYVIEPSLVVYFIPAYAGIGVLFVFVVMWLDEERVKKRYHEMRIER